MFSFLKSNPTRKLQKAYEKKLGQALFAQRNGNIREYSFLTAEAEEIRKEIEANRAEKES